MATMGNRLQCVVKSFTTVGCFGRSFSFCFMVNPKSDRELWISNRCTFNIYIYISQNFIELVFTWKRLCNSCVLFKYMCTFVVCANVRLPTIPFNAGKLDICWMNLRMSQFTETPICVLNLNQRKTRQIEIFVQYFS